MILSDVVEDLPGDRRVLGEFYVRNGWLGRHLRDSFFPGRATALVREGVVLGDIIAYFSGDQCHHRQNRPADSTDLDRSSGFGIFFIHSLKNENYSY